MLAGASPYVQQGAHAIYSSLYIACIAFTRNCNRCKQPGVYWKHGLCENPACEPASASVEHSSPSKHHHQYDLRTHITLAQVRLTLQTPRSQVFYTFTIGGVLLCVRMCHILILPYTHQGGIPPYTPRRHTSFMSIGALVKNKNSSCEDANTGEEEADGGSQERWVFF